MKHNVKKLKHSLKKKEIDSDPYLTLLNYRMAQEKHGLSSGDILLKRKRKRKMPAVVETDVRVTGDWLVFKDWQGKTENSVWLRVLEAATTSWKGWNRCCVFLLIQVKTWEWHSPSHMYLEWKLILIMPDFSGGRGGKGGGWTLTDT